MAYQFKGVKMLSAEQHASLLANGYYTDKNGNQVSEDPSYLYASDADTKVDKVTADEFTRVYGINDNYVSDGQDTTFIASQDTLDASIAIRQMGGQLAVSDPYASNQAANKGYVDDQINANKKYLHQFSFKGTISGASVDCALTIECNKSTQFADIAEIYTYLSTNYGTGFYSFYKPVGYGWITNKLLQITAMSAGSTNQIALTGIPVSGQTTTQYTITAMSITSYDIKEII